MKLLFENDTTKIYFDDTIPGLVQVWEGFAKGQPLRDAHEAFLRFQRQYGTSHSLSDLRKMRIIARDDQHWIETVFFPQVYEAGYRTVAIVASEDIFNQVSVKNIVLQVSPGRSFEVQYFEQEAPARSWLAQQP